MDPEFTSRLSAQEDRVSQCPQARLAIDCDGSEHEDVVLANSFYISFPLSVASCLGSVLILVAYLTLKDIRKGAQTIITQLALASFVYSGSHILGSANYLAFKGETDSSKCDVYQIICVIQAFITIWGSWAVFMWNSILAVYFMLLYMNRTALATNLMPLYVTIGWGLPIATSLPLLIMDKLGSGGVGMCYIKSSGSEYIVFLYIFWAGLFPEFVSCVLVVILYVGIVVHICRQSSEVLSSSEVHRNERRLLLVPILYLLLRVWDFTLTLLLLINTCDNRPLQVVIDINVALEAAGSTSQGWVDAIIFIFLSTSIRRRLFFNPLKRILKKCTLFRKRSSEQQPISQGYNQLHSPREAETTTAETHFPLPLEFSNSTAAQEDHGASLGEAGSHRGSGVYCSTSGGCNTQVVLQSSQDSTTRTTWFSPPPSGLASED